MSNIDDTMREAERLVNTAIFGTATDGKCDDQRTALLAFIRSLAERAQAGLQASIAPGMLRESD